MNKKTQTVYGLYYTDGVELPCVIGTSKEIARYFGRDERQTAVYFSHNLHGENECDVFFLGRCYTLVKLFEEDKYTKQIIKEY